jgi:uncharacterized protein involved in outer membrane biogenesis
MTLRRAAFRVAVLFGVLLLCAYSAVLLIANSARFQNWLRAELKDRTGYEVTGRARLDPLLRLTLSTVTVSRDAQPVLQAERILVTLSPSSLFSKNIHRLQLLKPALHLDLRELFDSAGKRRLDFSVRHLNIADGTLVLKLGDGHPVDFRSLGMNAENVNLGPGTGLNLRAHVPSLQGVVEIVASGDATEKKATIRIEQERARGSESQGAPALDANVTLTQSTGAPLRFHSSGQLNRMMMAAERLSGAFDLRAELTPNLKEAVISASFSSAEDSLRLPFLPVPLRLGAGTQSLKAAAELGQESLHIKSFQLESSLGEATGTGNHPFRSRDHSGECQNQLEKGSVLPSAAIASGNAQGNCFRRADRSRSRAARTVAFSVG